MSNKEPCPCMQNFTDMMKAAAPKNDLLRKIVCSSCGRMLWVSRETKYCFDCEAKLGEKVEQTPGQT